MKNFQQTKEVIAYLQKYITGKTLDLGAGSSKYRNIIKGKAQGYIAFDMKPGDNIDVVGDVLNLPFDENTFDTIVSTQVLEHVAKPWVMIKEIHRVLKNGGMCILTAPFLEPYHQSPTDYFRYTIDGLKLLFKNEGFEILECESYGKTFSVLSEFIRFSAGSSKVTDLMAKIAKFLDRFTKNKIIYSDVYIAAKK